jgi:hypothetical protein
MFMVVTRYNVQLIVNVTGGIFYDVRPETALKGWPRLNGL